MINIIKYNDLGGADHGWLKAKHHFSFASYQNPERVHFGPMRVINDDVVSPQTGFASHPHDNMEIITYVRKVYTVVVHNIPTMINIRLIHTRF